MQTRFAANFVRNISARVNLRTQYSGIGTFEWAFCLLERVAKMLELIAPDATFIILREACDKDDRCLDILATYDGETNGHAPCLYSDVMSRLCPAARRRLRTVEWPTPEIYQNDSLVALRIAIKAVGHTKDILNEEQRTFTTYECHCLKHGRRHKVYGDASVEAEEQPGTDIGQTVNTKEIVAAGLECIDYSLMGKRQRLAGRSTHNQLCWLHERRLRSEMETAVAVEETPGWDTKEMELTYKDKQFDP